ncbi:MAG: hypothetical protein ACKV22_31560 [Bryobacteraceae bacterium]
MHPLDSGFSRRELLGAGFAAQLPAAKRPKIAAVVTEYRKWSHAQHIVDRFLDGYGWDNRHHRPQVDIVSLYVDQVGSNDLSRERATRFPSMKIYRTIPEALTLGGGSLAVDGVILIAEHGKYPVNEKGQTQYPRYEFFRQIVDVFRASGRSVPVFNDKHLSWKWEWAREMVETARNMGFPMLAGSCVPINFRIPDVDIPMGAEVEEAMFIGVGGIDSYDHHALEGLQSLVERRRGGETGVAAIHAIKGDAVWKAMRAGSFAAGGWDPELFEACLCRSHDLAQPRKGFNHILPSLDEIPGMVPKPVAYRIEYADGLRATMLLLTGLASPHHFAARIKGRKDPISIGFYLPGRGVKNGGTEAPFFNPLAWAIEQLFLTGKPLYPVERTLLTTGTAGAGVESLWLGQKRIETPHLSVRYQPPRQPFYWGARSFPPPSPDPGGRTVSAATPRKHLAIVATIWTYTSHSQHIGDRFIVGYPRGGRWHKPEMDVVSLWVDQKPEDDESAIRARQSGFTLYPTIAEALRCGGGKLAVDAVLIIGEHGKYPRNEKGQVLYPRYEFFQQVTEVFRKDGRVVPVFNDKHLSYSFEKAKKMVETSRELRFPMLAGSSVPVTWRLPSIELPIDCRIEDALMVGTGGSDAHDFHALEGLQCMVERRRGGETGVKRVQLIEGDAVWAAGRAGVWSERLLEAALSCATSFRGMSVEDGRTQDLVRNGQLPVLVPAPAAYVIEYRDGLRATLLWLNGAISNFLFAGRVNGSIQSTQFFLGPGPNVTYSACLASGIEEMIRTGVAPYPVERTLLVSGMLERCLESKLRGGRRLQTPELEVRYRAPKRAQFGLG